ncbi:ethylene-responsive transcription factor ERF003-like [Hibiscus syriacus]|uniref:ethylene-responsive transcription factor ERF003-like n=1 Tax=Hibiscus syriacus TaxID=106335 RepID=UPI0019204D78|nr:ethylene-responsive transcription factor ERF003-like [Hibiscus syriacus]
MHPSHHPSELLSATLTAKLHKCQSALLEIDRNKAPTTPHFTGIVAIDGTKEKEATTQQQFKPLEEEHILPTLLSDKHYSNNEQ